MEVHEQVIIETLKKYESFRNIVPNATNHFKLFEEREQATQILFYSRPEKYPNKIALEIGKGTIKIIYNNFAACTQPEKYFEEQVEEHKKYHAALLTELNDIYKIRNLTLSILADEEEFIEDLSEGYVNFMYDLYNALKSPKYWLHGTTRNREIKKNKEQLEKILVGHDMLREAFDNGEAYMKDIIIPEIKESQLKEKANQIIQLQGEISTMHGRIVLDLGRELSVYDHITKIAFNSLN